MKPTAAEYRAHGSDLEKMLAEMGILPRERDRMAELKAEFAEEEREEAERKIREKIRQDAEKSRLQAFLKERARLRKVFPKLGAERLDAMASANCERAELG